MISLQCISCAHYRMGSQCKAYPDGIPYEIISGQIDHNKSYKGDNGIQFKSDEDSLDKKEVSVKGFIDKKGHPHKPHKRQIKDVPKAEVQISITGVEDLDQKIFFVKQEFKEIYKEEKDLEVAISKMIGPQTESIDYQIHLETDNISNVLSVKNSLTEISSNLNDTLKSLMGKININISAEEGRSYYDGYDTIVLTEDHTRKSILAHEIGHVIEANKKSVHHGCVKFIENRTKGEKEVKLDTLFPDAGYDENEIVKKDKFLHPYCGKIQPYMAATEILSMGMQLLQESDTAKKFYKKDPDHFYLCLAIIAGRI